MSTTSGFQYFKIKVAFPPTNIGYTSPIVATLDVGRYIIVATMALVGNLNTIYFDVAMSAPPGIGDLVLYTGITNVTLTDGSPTAVCYRGGIGQFLVTVPNTPVYYQIAASAIAGANYQTSTAATDVNYNYFHFIKVA